MNRFITATANVESHQSPIHDVARFGRGLSTGCGGRIAQGLSLPPGGGGY